MENLRKWVNLFELFLLNNFINLSRLWFILFRGTYTFNNYLAYDRAISLIKMNKIEGDFAEFGVGSGASATMIGSLFQKYLKNSQTHFHLFDTFEGLPEPQGLDKHPQWEKGSWNFSKRVVEWRISKINLMRHKTLFYEGYFNKFSSKDLPHNLKLSLVHFDCDLMSSTENALNIINPFISEGAIFLFDDYFCYGGDPKFGEARAFSDWQINSKFKAIDWFSYSSHGKAFIMVRK